MVVSLSVGKRARKPMKARSFAAKSSSANKGPLLLYLSFIAINTWKMSLLLSIEASFACFGCWCRLVCLVTRHRFLFFFLRISERLSSARLSRVKHRCCCRFSLSRSLSCSPTSSRLTRSYSDDAISICDLLCTLLLGGSPQRRYIVSFSFGQPDPCHVCKTSSSAWKGGEDYDMAASIQSSLRARVCWRD